jgi:hypothetical protein
VDTRGLEGKIAYLEGVVETRLPQQPGARRVAVALRELYATRSAASILLSVHGLCPEKIESARSLAQQEDHCHLEAHLPSLKAVKNAVPRLVNAIASGNENEAVNALAEMGIFALFPIPEKVFSRLELCVRCVIGRARLIPLLELASLATELGFHDKTVSYLSEAHTLAPEPPELHDIHTICGIVALAAGQVEEAKAHLAESVRVCREDEYALVTCGIRPFNITLAKKLLERGESAAVFKYLTRCQGVWTYEGKRIASWIEAIQNDREPDFFAPSIRNALEKPAARIRDLTLRSMFLAGTPGPPMQKPNHGIRGEVGEMRARYKSDIAAAMKGKLGTGKN